MNAERDEIAALYRRYWRNMVEKDVEGLHGLMTADYTLRHMTGVTQSADTFLRGLENGTFNYYSAEHDSIEVIVDGSRASMIGKSRVLAAVYGGGKHLWRLRGDFTLRKEDGVWKLASSTASTY